MTATKATHAALLKELYTDDRVFNMVVQNQPFFGMVPKYEQYEGSQLPIPIVTSNPQGASSDIVKAINNASATTSQRFLVDTITDYTVAKISRKLIKESGTKRGAWLSGAATEIDGALNQAKRRIGKQLYRSAGGAIGQIESLPSTTTARIVSIGDMYNFEVGMTVSFATLLTGGSTKTPPGGGAAKITAIGIQDRLLTFDTDLTTYTAAVAANDYIQVDGDYDATCAGLEDWVIADATVSATPFKGVDRSTDKERLAGTFYDAAANGLNHEDALIEAESRVHNLGGNVDAIFVNNADFRVLKKLMNARIERTDVLAAGGLNSKAKISYSAILLDGCSRPIPIFSDPNCPVARGYLLQMDTWKLYSSGAACDLFDKDNDQQMLREALADSYEVRVGGYYELGCRAPGFNGVVDFKTEALT